MKHRTGKFVFAMVAVAVAVVPLLSQTPGAKKPSFDVVSIKPSPPGGNVMGMRPLGASFTATNSTMRMLLQFAFRLPNNQPPQILGGPNWIDSDHFDIQARLDGDSRQIPQAEMQLMVQSLLEDRFQLKAHRETRELPVFELTIAKGGVKMKLSEDQTPPNLGAGPRGEPPAGARGTPSDIVRGGPPPRGAITMMMNQSGATLSATAAPMSTLLNLLQGQAGRPIIDKTDLKGLFDFSLQFAPAAGGQLTGLFGTGGPPAGPSVTPPTAADPAPSFFTAIQEQLGLKLEATKGPVEVLVIDSVQKPMEN